MCRSYRHTIAQTRPNAAHSEPELADLDGRNASRSQVPLGALLTGGSSLTPEAAEALIIRARSPSGRDPAIAAVGRTLTRARTTREERRVARAAADAAGGQSAVPVSDRPGRHRAPDTGDVTCGSRPVPLDDAVVVVPVVIAGVDPTAPELRCDGERALSQVLEWEQRGGRFVVPLTDLVVAPKFVGLCVSEKRGREGLCGVSSSYVR